MDSNKIEYLTFAFLNEGLNAQERDELKVLLQDPDMRDFFKKNYIAWYNLSLEKEDENSERLFQRIIYQLDKHGNKTIQPHSHTKRLIISVAVAASVLSFILGIGSYHWINHSENMAFWKKQTTQESIPDLKSKITVPLGSKSQVELPDGTSVTLNAGSILEYTGEYGKNTREVRLVGEGYFKVAKNEQCAFIVNAYNTSIKALGTEFNVKAYAEEDFVQTTLVEGSVSINPNVNTDKKAKDIILQPNQMMIIYKNTDKHAVADVITASPLKKQPVPDKGIIFDVKDTKVSMETVNTILFTSWKDQRWVIEGEEMGELAQKLQRRYDVNINIKDEALKKYKFSGILEDETLEQVLNIIKTIAPIDYKIDKKEVFLSMNNRQRKAFEESMN